MQDWGARDGTQSELLPFRYAERSTPGIKQRPLRLGCKGGPPFSLAVPARGVSCVMGTLCACAAAYHRAKATGKMVVGASARSHEAGPRVSADTVALDWTGDGRPWRWVQRGTSPPTNPIALRFGPA